MNERTATALLLAALAAGAAGARAEPGSDPADPRLRASPLAADFGELPARGAEDAVVTIVEFSDFQCPYCVRASNTVEEILRRYPQDVRVVYAHFPLRGIHPWAMPAAIAATCAAAQSHDAFWLLHDAYFGHQEEIDLDNLIERSAGFLAGAGIDLAAWRSCAAEESSPAHQQARARVRWQQELGGRHGVSGTPSFFVGGSLLSGAKPVEVLARLVEQELAASR